MEAFQVEQMIADVSRARNDLAVLAVDDSVTLERFTQCEVAALNLETVVTELLTTAWVPKNSCELAASIVSVHKNIEQVQADIAAALDVVLLECKPDELYRAFIALSFSRLLEFQLDVLMTTLAHSMQCSCGCRGFVPEAWAN